MFKNNNTVNEGLGSLRVRKARGFFFAFMMVMSSVVMANDFSANTLSGCSPVVTRFTHTFGGVSNLVWNFGDGTTSTAANPGKVYSSGGYYTVTLTVTLANGTSQTVTKANYIHVFEQPVPNFSANIPSNQCLESAVVGFSDLSSANVVRRVWDFGDGNISTALNPTHTYSTSKSYTVTLHTWTADSCYAANAQTIQVSYLEKPRATFTLSDSVFCSPNAHTASLGAVVSRGTISNYAWNVRGLGNFSTANPTINFPTSGNYTITLVATAANGCKDTISNTATIEIRTAIPSLQSYATSTCSGAPVAFGITGNNKNVTWNFSDGSQATGNPVSKSFNGKGTYTFTAISQDLMGCIDQFASNQNIVVSAPISLVNITTTACTAPYGITANAQLITATSVKMWLKDGNGLVLDSTNNSSFATTVSAKGNYTLLVRSLTGNCSFDTIYNININSEIKAAYTTSVDSGCYPLMVRFNDASTVSNNDIIVSRVWDFGNGQTASGSQVSTWYATRGGFNVRFIIKSQNGCTDTLFTENRIKAGSKPTALFFNPDTAGCKTILRSFKDASTGTITSWFWNFGNGTTSLLQNPNKPVAYSSPGSFKTTLIVRNFGCADTLVNDSNVTVYPPKAAFVTTENIGCSLPHSVHFTNTTAEGISFAWNFGEKGSLNNTDTSFNAVHTYNSYGSFNVTLIATSKYGCSDTIVKKNYIKIADPKPGFVATDSVGCAPYTGKVINTSTPGTYTYFFGNNTTSTPSYRFARPGKYMVKVVMIDSIGCVDSFQVHDQIWVKGLMPDFMATPTSGCAPFLAQFQPTFNTIPVVSYAWNFGDSTTATSSNPSHNFTQKRNYTIKLSVTDTDGCISTSVKNNYIQAINPTAAFTNVAEVCLGGRVVFNNTSGTGMTAKWNFGDGFSSSSWNGNHTYTTAGTYTVKLVVTNAAGCSDSIEKVNTIKVTKFQTTVANAKITGFCAPALVTFKSTTIGATSWKWTFGDSATSTLASPAHTYGRNGFFNVSLITSNALGCTDTLKIDSMVQVVGPTPSFTFNQTQACAPAVVTFQNNSTSYKTALWDFRDGTLLRTNNPTHAYTRAGSFQPILIVTDSLGCSASITAKTSINVIGMPKALFGMNAKSVCAGTSIQFANNSQGAVQYAWSFGDGGTSTVANPIHAYNQSGTYNIRLVVTNASGCTDTLIQSQTIQINQRPTANFTANSVKVCMPGSIDLKDQSNSPNGPIVSYSWSFSDRTSSINRNPSKSFTASGVYTVSLKVTDIFGCTDSVVKTNYLTALDSTLPANIVTKVATVNNNREIDLNWNTSLDANFTQYQLFRKEASANNFTLVFASTNISDSSFKDLAVQVGVTPYTYIMVQKNVCGRNSALDLAYAHTTVHLSTEPSAQAREIGVSLKWNKYVGFLANTRGNTVAEYRVFRKETTSNNFTLVATLTGEDTSFTDKGLCSDNYTYRVEAVAQNGTIASSNWSTSHNAVFSFRDRLDLMNATVTTENHVALIWKSAPIFNAALYQILRKDAITGDYLRIAQVSATDTTFVDETAQADKKSYSYKIRVIDACGNSNDLSNEATSIFVQMETKEFQVSLNWNQYNEWKNGVQYYIIDRLNPTTGQFDSIATVRGTSYTEDPSHLNLANYVYRVRGIEQSGNQMVSVSNIVKNTLKPTLYIPTAFTPNGDQLNDQFKVVGMHIKEIEIEIYNRWGEMIFHTNNINDGWDGTFKGADAMQDSYVFKVRATAENGETFLKSGVVSLVRNNQ